MGYSIITTMAGSFLPQAARGVAVEQYLLPEWSVLCVQPNASQQDVLRTALTTFRVNVVGSALEAMRALNGSAFDAYVLDYWLPDWGGAALCREIRKTDPNVPVIFYTAAGDRHVARALRAGATAYFGTAVAPGAIRERLEMLVERTAQRSSQAVVGAERVVERELARESAATDGPRDAGYLPSLIERSVRTKAEKAFIDAGGIRAAFERCWVRELALLRASRRAGTSFDETGAQSCR